MDDGAGGNVMRPSRAEWAFTRQIAYGIRPLGQVFCEVTKGRKVRKRSKPSRLSHLCSEFSMSKPSKILLYYDGTREAKTALRHVAEEPNQRRPAAFTRSQVT